eukprot:scaffold98510_cov63-Phaeocystis_antarctica.AAC.2
MAHVRASRQQRRSAPRCRWRGTGCGSRPRASARGRGCRRTRGRPHRGRCPAAAPSGGAVSGSPPRHPAAPR